MKHQNALRLARLARHDCWYGGAKALSLALRASALGLGDEMVQIVSRVYGHPRGQAVWTCMGCDSEWLTEEDARLCCADGWEEQDATA